MSLINKITFNELGDERGKLVALEANKNVPFSINRVYYIYGTTDSKPRGFHAHKDLEQVAICLRGSCRFILDNGRVREETLLDSPSVGLYISSMTWREMHEMSPDCLLMVLASKCYDEDDYIRSYQDFIELANHDDSSVK